MAQIPVRVMSPERPETISVAQFNRTVKATLEDRFPAVWVEGEIVSCKIAASGHAYFDLKDDKEDARVACCLFRQALARSRVTIKDGERVAVRARASLYPARGSFQLIVESVVAAGAGGAAAALEALKRKLAAEGLFAPERKRTLPRFPRAIGVVTSASGAAFHDICRVAEGRWPVRIVLAPTVVQGTRAPESIVQALAAIQRVPGIDVIIVGRGGGSSEDLSAFNDESVARAIAMCDLPVISAVGHEIDTTVADLVADVRASTPSNAAEIALPERAAVQHEVHTHAVRLAQAVRARVHARSAALARLEKRLGDPGRVTQGPAQVLDDARQRLVEALRSRLRRQRRTLEQTHVRLRGAHPKTRVARDSGALHGLRQRLEAATRVRVVALRSELGARVGRLAALSPLAVLARGYSVTLAHGRAVTDADQVTTGDTVTVRLHRGAIDATVTRTRTP